MWAPTKRPATRIHGGPPRRERHVMPPPRSSRLPEMNGWWESTPLRVNHAARMVRRLRRCAEMDAAVSCVTRDQTPLFWSAEAAEHTPGTDRERELSSVAIDNGGNPLSSYRIRLSDCCIQFRKDHTETRRYGEKPQFSVSPWLRVNSSSAGSGRIYVQHAGRNTVQVHQRRLARRDAGRTDDPPSAAPARYRFVPGTGYTGRLSCPSRSTDATAKK